jgi:hypothetical protein
VIKRLKRHLIPLKSCLTVSHLLGVSKSFFIKKILGTEAKDRSTTNSLRERNDHHCFKLGSNLGGHGSNQLSYQLG